MSVLAGHRLISASDQEAALSGLGRDVLLRGWLLTASDQVFAAALVPSSFYPQLQVFKLLLCYLSSGVLLISSGRRVIFLLSPPLCWFLGLHSHVVLAQAWLS